MITVPLEFAQGVVAGTGDAGRAWIERLPALVESLCTQWNLVVDGPPMHGYLGLVVPVMRGAELCVLKVSWMDQSTAHEIAALVLWNGQGAVRLLEADPTRGALLLERLNSRQTLGAVEVGRAVPIAGHLLRRLAVPASPELPLLKDMAARLTETIPARWARLDRPMPRALIDAACATAALLGPSAAPLLVNYDLHYGNVLAGQREAWLAIDPKVVVGDPEFGLAQLLWTRLEDMQRDGGLNTHFHRLVDQADLDIHRARSWTLVRCVDYWLWALSVGLTEDPARCAVITTWLMA